MKERGRVVKEVKPSGNSGSVYVPREWIGQSVEVRLFSAESLVLEALYPYVDSIVGIYLFGPHARGPCSPDLDVDVLVVAERELSVERLEGINLVVVLLDELEAYAGANPAEYSGIVNEAVPLMNGQLLEQMRTYRVDGELSAGFPDAVAKSLAIARSLALEGDYASAAYALVQRLKDYSVLSSGGKYSYEHLEDYVSGRGFGKERFRKLFEVYEAKKRDSEPAYGVSSEDIAGLYTVLEQVLGSLADKSKASSEDSSREALLDRARKYKEGCGSAV